MIPPSLNVYRGQTDQGPGEPGTTLGHGGQDLAADAPLQADPQLLRDIRQWLTLDADPGDHQRLGGRLVGWSCFPAGPYYFVVRLAAAGDYARRDACFAHGRAWPLSAFAADFDPGLYLGQEAAFLKQAPPPTAGAAQWQFPTDEEPAQDFQEALLEPIPADKALTASLIAHLFHGMVTGLPVILAVPPTAFATDTPLARTIAFARAALPGRLRRRCRIRVFSRNPALFLVPDPAPDTALVDLLVIPEELAGAALSAVRRRALLLDTGGERRDGPAPAAGLSDYAGGVIESARRFPSQLTRFGERFDALWGERTAVPGPAPTPLGTPGRDAPAPTDLTGWVTLTYNLAVALAGGEAQCGSLFANFLLTQARANPQVPWAALIRPQDWARFAQDQLIRFILRADDAVSPGEERLQAALIDAFQRLGNTVDAGLAAWWNPAEATKRRRLLELCDLTPPLVADARAAALTRPLGIADLAAGGGPLTGALRAEYRAGVLGARRGEAPQLLACLFDPAGRLRIGPTPAVAVLLLETAPIAGRLRPRDLITLGALLPESAGPAIAAYHERIGTLMNLEPQQTTAHLIQAGAWLAWRRHADPGLDQDARRRFALTWITSPALAALRDDGARVRPPQWRLDRTGGRDGALVDITRETWDQVMTDLDRFAPADIRLLTQPDTHWPWLHPFQQDQARDLAARCRDPDAQAVLAADLARTGADPDEADGSPVATQVQPPIPEIPTPPRGRGRPWRLAGLLVLGLLGVLGAAWWVGRLPGNTAPPAGAHRDTMEIPWPGPDWSPCGPPWFCKEPFAPPPQAADATACGSPPCPRP